MKKNSLLLILIFLAFSVKGQINIATGGTVTTCSDVFVDSGGLGGNYSSNENYEITICPDAAGNYIQLDFTTVNIEGGFDDFLVIYNGSSSTAPIFGTVNDDTTCDITQYTSSAAGGCLTVVFVSDNLFNPSGWEANISCTSISGGSSTVPENSVCAGASAFCADAGALEFPNSSDNDCVPDAPNVVVDNSCLNTAPNPAWYFVEIGVAGDIIINIAQTTGPNGTGAGLDVDYVVWGPFSDASAACVDFTSGDCSGDHNCTGTVVDCSYSIAPVETATIPNAQVGEFYMFLITNFEGDPGYITLTQTNLGNSGAGSTDCCPYITGVNPSTCGASDGFIEISLLTPNTPYTITYNDPAPQSVTLTSNALGNLLITGLAAGTYTAIDANTPACSPEDITLIDAAAPILTSLTAVSPICSGSNADFAITGTPNAILSYTVNGGAIATINLDASGNAQISIGGVTTDTVLQLLNITLNSCTTVLTNSATVVVNPIPIFNSLTSNAAVCTGQDAVFTVSGTPNATLMYSINGGGAASLVLDASGNGIVTITGITVDTTMTITTIVSNACSVNVNVSETVIMDPVLAVSSLTDNGPICFGQDAIFDVIGSPNSTITYTVNGGAPMLLTIDSTGVGVLTIPAATATITVNLTSLSLSGCSIVLTNSATVVVIPTPNVTSITAVSPICAGQDAVFNITGTPNAIVTYAINGAAPQLVTLDGSGNGILTIIGATGNLSLLLSDVAISGCNSVLNSSETIVVTPIPTLAIIAYSNPTICSGSDGSLVLATTNLPDGSYTINYIDINGVSQTETMVVLANVGTVFNMEAGSYSNITVTHVNCTSVDVVNAQLTDPLIPTLAILTAVNPTTCEGTDGYIALATNLPDGVYTVDYEDSAASSQTVLITVTANVGLITGIAAGTYNNISITYLNCTSIDDVDVVLIDPLPAILAIIAVVNPTICDGTDGSITLSTLNLPDGTYTINYEDGLGMTHTNTIDVIGNIGVISNLSEGQFNNITVTYLSCASVDDIDVVLYDPIPSIIAILSIDNPTMCNSFDGIITLSVANLIDGTYTVDYEDENGVEQTTLIEVVDNVGVISSLPAGTYDNITIISFSCRSIEDIDVQLLDPVPAILAVISTGNPNTCNGQDGEIIVSTYNLPDGTYSINYEDALSVPQTATMVVVANVGAITGLSSGVYANITVTHLGCISLEDIDVILIDPLPPNVNDAMHMQPICETDDVIDGVMPHDLTLNTPEILGGQTGITISFYETLVDASSGTNPIPNATTYYNSNPTMPITTQIIYVRAIDDLTNCVSVVSFTITVLSTEVNVPSPLASCDDDNDGYFYFVIHNSITLNEITNGNSDILVTYYETLAQANLGVPEAQLTSPYQNVTAYNQTIYARAQQTVFDCYRIVPLELNVIDGPALPQNDIIYRQCEDSGSSDGFTTFDLLSYELTNLLSVIIQNGGDVANYTINYYTSLDASGSPDVSTLISNPGSYQNTITPNQTIYASIVSVVTGCESIQPINLQVDLLPEANYSQQHKCDDAVDDGFTLFDLTTYEAAITGGVSNVEVSYYTNETDAEQGSETAVIPNPENFINSVNPQSIFVRILNPETMCFEVALLTLHVQPNPTPLSTGDIELQLGNSGVMEECDGDVDGSGSLSEQVSEFDLTLWEEQILTGYGPGVESGVSATYYTSFEAAEGGDQADAITTPEAYTNTSNPQTIYVRVTNDGTGIVPATDGSGCYVIVEFDIFVPVPEVRISGNDILCIDENGLPLSNATLPVLVAETDNAGYDYQWSLNGIEIPGATFETYTVTQAGEYTVTISGPSDFDCINYASTIIEASGMPEGYNAEVTTNAFADHHQIIATATSSNPAIEFIYALDGGEFISSGIFNDVVPGIHYVTIADSRGCWERIVSILVIDYPKFFTPNGDGVNDTWQIIGIEGIPISIIYIFDRYGKLLKQLDPDGAGWDGTYNGHLMPADDYWFTIQYIEGTTPIEKEFKAHFSIKR